MNAKVLSTGWKNGRLKDLPNVLINPRKTLTIFFFNFLYSYKTCLNFCDLAPRPPKFQCIFTYSFKSELFVVTYAKRDIALHE